MKTKAELKEYLECDRRALNIPAARKRPRLFGDEIWAFEILLRKREYYSARSGLLNKPFMLYYTWRWHRASVRLGFSIPINAFGAGLSIAHRGTIVVNGNARIGRNCRLQESVTIGTTGGSQLAPRIGDGVFIGSGARIIGDIEIADGVAIGAGAVVVRSCAEKNVTLAGVPAKIVSHKGAECMSPWMSE